MEYFFAYLSIFSPLLPLLTLTVRKVDSTIRWVVLFVILSFLSDLINLIIIKMDLIEGNNYFMYKIYGFLETAVLLVFYYKVLDKKRLVWMLGSIFLVFYLVDVIYIEPDSFHAFGRSVQSILLIFYSLMLFLQFFQKEEDIFLDRKPVFWVNVGLMVYFSGAFFSFMLSNYLLNSPQYIWAFHNFSNFLKNLLIGIGIWKSR